LHPVAAQPWGASSEDAVSGDGSSGAVHDAGKCRGWVGAECGSCVHFCKRRRFGAAARRVCNRGEGNERMGLRGTHCFNPPAARSFLPIYLMKTKMVMSGAVRSDDRAIPALGSQSVVVDVRIPAGINDISQNSAKVFAGFD